MKRIVVLLAVAFALASPATPARAAVIYVTNGDSSVMQAYNTSTGAQVFSVSTFGLAYPIAVRDSIWVGHLGNNSNVAREYSTATGAATGNTANMSSPLLFQLLDGTTDGTFNYAIRWDTGEVYRANLDWSGMASTPLFTAGVPGGDLTGITYDSASGHLWLSNGTTAFEYTLGGTLVSSFAHASNRNGLAYDASTNSLWFVPNDRFAPLLQYSTTGTLLNTVATPERSGNIWGAEIALAPEVPEPATLAVFGALAAGAFVRRRVNRVVA